MTDKNTNIVITKDIIKKLYAGRGLRRKAIKQIVEAHIDVLNHGLADGTEMVFVIDRKTGAVVAKEVGSATRVVWEMDKAYKGELVVIHNHPNNTPFSTKDIYSFSSVKQIRIISIQAHSGIIYMLAKKSNKNVKCDEDFLKGALSKIRQMYRGKTHIEQGEIFVKHIANMAGWSFLKGGERRE